MCYLKKNGTYDLIGKDSLIWQNIVSKITKICTLYNYNFIKTPIFEDTNLFLDIIGKNTDVISKELYNFYDKNNDEISLRPEGTTGVLRSYIENNLYKDGNVHKFYYYGSMFRHENVEKGRFREFQQFGVEVFNDNNYRSDVEIILLAVNIFKSLGIEDITVYINNLGSKDDKINYENVLREYFKNNLNDLCEDCKKRFNENPIRILDCKIDKRNEFILNAPKIDNYINNESKVRFNKILEYLDKLDVNYIVNKNLVRGLNYYTDTVFEIKTNIDGLGARNTICGGGRYNSSVMIDDKNTIPAMGFAIGLERLIDILNKKDLLKTIKKEIDFNLLFDDIELLNVLRNNGFISDYNSSDMSKYTIEKDNQKYILTDNKKDFIYCLEREELIEKIVSNEIC